MAETPAQRARREKKERHAEATIRREVEGRRARARGAARAATMGVALVATVAAVAGIFWLLNGDRRAAADRLAGLVISEPTLGGEHVENPTVEPAPTSGAHVGAPVCGVETRQIPPQNQIHTLEHGGTIIQYRDADVSAADVGQLADLVNQIGEGILVAPNERLDAPLVVTAWTQRMNLDELDVEKISDFVTAYGGAGPEDVPCPI